MQTSPPVSSPSPSYGTFRSLRHAGFRLLIAAQLSTSFASWMEQVARGWLVYEMTGSATALGLVQACRAAPLLIFGLWAGVAADRYDRKRQLLLAQNANAVLNVILAALIITGRVQPWHVFATAFMAGSVMAFQSPARQSIIPDVVGRDDLMNAIALNSGVVNGSRTIGPAIAGLIIAVVGVGGSYIVQALLFVLASWWTAKMTVSRLQPVAAGETAWQSLLDGFRYIRGRPVVVMLLLIAIIPILLAQPYQSLMPVFARDIYEIGPLGQGILLSASGVGAVLGALANATWGDTGWKGLHMLIGLVLFGVGLIAFALSPWLALALIALGFVGGANTSYRAVTQALLQTHTDDAYRGRVMSIYLLDRGFAPLGSVVAGLLTDAMGARSAVVALGGMTVLVAGAALASMPRLWRLN